MGLVAAPQCRDGVASSGHYKGGLEGINRGCGGGITSSSRCESTHMDIGGLVVLVLRWRRQQAGVGVQAGDPFRCLGEIQHIVAFRFGLLVILRLLLASPFQRQILWLVLGKLRVLGQGQGLRLRKTLLHEDNGALLQRAALVVGGHFG